MKQLYQCDQVNNSDCPAKRNVLKNECCHFKPHLWSKACMPKKSYPKDRICIAWGIINPFDGTEEAMCCQCKKLNVEKKGKEIEVTKKFPTSISQIEL